MVCCTALASPEPGARGRSNFDPLPVWVCGSPVALRCRSRSRRGATNPQRSVPSSVQCCAFRVACGVPDRGSAEAARRRSCLGSLPGFACVVSCVCARTGVLGQPRVVFTILCQSVSSSALMATTPRCIIWRVTRSGDGRGQAWQAREASARRGTQNAPSDVQAGAGDADSSRNPH